MEKEGIRKQISIMKASLKYTTIEEPGRRTILENGLRIIGNELDKEPVSAEDKVFFIHRGKTGLSPTQYYYLVEAKDEDSALEKVGLFNGDEELLVIERVYERSLLSAQLKEGALIAQVALG